MRHEDPLRYPGDQNKTQNFALFTLSSWLIFSNQDKEERLPVRNGNGWERLSLKTKTETKTKTKTKTQTQIKIKKRDCLLKTGTVGRDFLRLMLFGEPWLDRGQCPETKTSIRWTP